MSYRQQLEATLANFIAGEGSLSEAELAKFVRASEEESRRTGRTGEGFQPAQQTMVGWAYTNLVENRYSNDDYERAYLRTALLSTFFAAIMAETHEERHFLGLLIEAAMVWRVKNGH